MSLDHLVHVHTSKREKAKHYSRQLTYSLALVCLVFFGTIVTYQATATNFNEITGFATYLSSADAFTEMNTEASDITGFVLAIRQSPNLVLYKLFFYTLWIMAVLVGSAIWYEFKEKE